MMNPIFIGKHKIDFSKNSVKGEPVILNGEHYFKISDISAMRPFFMSIVSDSNHWLFISSNGGLTAGRKDCDTALFPYNTDDKITESAEITGSKTIIQIHKEDRTFLWEPFSDTYKGLYSITRNLYKNSIGNKIIFEEINHDLGLTYRYQWNTSKAFGFVKKSSLLNNLDVSVQCTVLDGLQNILPYGLTSDLQQSKSNLVDAYKKNELEKDLGLGIYTLSAVIVDRAEPSEALKATTVWSIGLTPSTHLISALQLTNFRRGHTIHDEIDMRAEKGAYFVASSFGLNAHADRDWITVADVNQGPSSIVHISEKLKNKDQLYKDVLIDIEKGSAELIDLVGNADGLQITGDHLRDTRHFANVTFNIMRGGIFDENYKIERSDFSKYIWKANHDVFNLQEAILLQLPEIFSLQELKEIANETDNSDFTRLCFEYLPLKFSRRHGDPSRPWNKFSINTQSEVDGSKILDYQGNWRDIFQNWEALAHAYPNFMESMIHKFLNATTFDGYNPYRVTKDGFDWEVIEPDDAWTFIGYWGDHQIIYLLKFLEFIEDHYPAKLTAYFEKEVFVYANVPYKIKSYSELLKDPKNTIDFDHNLDAEINHKKKEVGADGALLLDQKNEICKVNLIEKLLATVLAKCSNFIPGAGIWLNTQRPEWNDANNALVGNGVSMVTLYYLRRFLHFFNGILLNANTEIAISEELTLFFNDVRSNFIQYEELLSAEISNKDRKRITDGFGIAGDQYRNSVYSKGFTGNKKSIQKKDILHFVEIALKYIDHSIISNKRSDNLYHAYNLMTLENPKEISISRLPEMLEGQVAVLSSGFLSANDSLQLLDNLRKSDLYRKDQNSYLLYPNKQLSRFVNKNSIPSEKVEKSVLIKRLLSDGNSQIIEKDVKGGYHFNGIFNNANSLKEALSKLPKKYKDLIEKDESYLLTIFEQVFDHKSFTGRSGTFFGYEGLGSIYWHMVSKLVLAVQENCFKAVENEEDEIEIAKLNKHYYEINEGIGLHKSPELYGAFPTDPYSHTPAGKGAQQPGMTGQVKEDILCRFGELGVFVKNGLLHFKPGLLRVEEFLPDNSLFKYSNVNNQEKTIALEKGSLCFTYCQVPVIYKTAHKNSIELIFTNKPKIIFKHLKLDKKTSEQVFSRTGEVQQINVYLKK